MNNVNKDSSKCSEPIVIACCANERFSVALAVMLYSLLSNVKPRTAIVLYVVGSDFSKRTISRLKSLVARFPEVDTELNVLAADMSPLQNLPLNFRFSADNYTRLLLPAIIPEKHDKVLYLDSDLLICADIGELWSLNVGEWHVLAATDMAIPLVSSLLGLRNYQSLGFAPETPYFNSGVLLINLKKWREDKVSELCLDYTRGNMEFIRWADQDSLNVILYGKWGNLDVKWNYVPRFLRKILADKTWPNREEFVKRRNELSRSPAIYHFAGPIKPWKSYLIVPGHGRWISTYYGSGFMSIGEKLAWPLTALVEGTIVLFKLSK